MNKTLFYHVLLASFVLVISIHAQDAKPNIVYLFADELRAQALGCMGNTLIQTPSIDKLASQGMLTTNAYACTPLCGPYRAQLMTGMYNWHHGCPKNDQKLPNELECYAEVFRANGYATGYVGKWHLNGNRRGFVELEDRQGWDFWAALACSHEYFNTRYYYDDPNAPVYIVDGYEPENQTDEAIGFMQRNVNNPFCLMVSYGPPHFPLSNPPEGYPTYDPADIPLRPNVPQNREAVAREELAMYYAMTTSVDSMVGRIMAALDSLGLSENTVLAFSSDHGDMSYSQGHIRKVLPWQESVNVPFIIRYPEAIAANQKSDMFINSVDVMPTMLGLAGIDVPDQVDGINLAPRLTGASTEERRSVLLTQTADNATWAWWGWRAIVEKEWKYVISPNGGWLLYNLKDDPYEMNNLIDDPAYRDQYAIMHARLTALREANGDTATLQTVEGRNPPVHSDPPEEVVGCVDPDHEGFDPLATINDTTMCGPVAVGKGVQPTGSMNTNLEKGILHLSLGNAGSAPVEVTLLDLRGKAVFHKQLLPSHSGSLKQAVPDLDRGVYVLKVMQQGGETFIVKIPALK